MHRLQRIIDEPAPSDAVSVRTCRHPDCGVQFDPRQPNGGHGRKFTLCVEHRKDRYKIVRARIKKGLPPPKSRTEARERYATFAEVRMCLFCRTSFVARDRRQQYCDLVCWEWATRERRAVQRDGTVRIQQ